MGNIIRFFAETKSELLKVVWPSYSEFIGSTAIVLVLVGFFSVYLGLADFLLTTIAQQVF